VLKYHLSMRLHPFPWSPFEDSILVQHVCKIKHFVLTGCFLFFVFSSFLFGELWSRETLVCNCGFRRGHCTRLVGQLVGVRGLYM